MRKIWDWYYGTATIRKKLVISYLILVLLPILILGVYSYYISKRSLLEQTRSTMEGNMSSIVHSMERNIQRENDNIKYLSYNVSFREKLETGAGNASALAQELNSSVEPTFWYFITSDDNIKAIEIYSPYVEHAIGSFLKPVGESGEEQFYKEQEKTYKTRWSYGEESIYAARTLLDANTSSRAIGVMKFYKPDLSGGVFKQRRHPCGRRWGDLYWQAGFGSLYRRRGTEACRGGRGQRICGDKPLHAPGI